MSEQVAMYLELAAAKAKQLAEDEKHGRLWPGEMSSGIGEIQDALRKAQAASNK